MSLEIVQAIGPYLMVGEPRLDRRRFGVPVGGPFDREAKEIACLLAGGADEAFEVAFGTFTFRAQTKVRVGVAGAIGSVSVEGADILLGEGSLSLQPNEPLVVRLAGARGYVAATEGEGPVVRLTAPPVWDGILRYIPAPNPLFDLSESSAWVSPTSDRMGVRLERAGPAHRTEAPSEPACVGAVQLTPDGTLIILGPDGPTIGGYPKVGYVCSADLDQVGRLVPGQSVRFKPVSFEEARTLLAHKNRRLRELTITTVIL